jgi:hypothetical protein
MRLLVFRIKFADTECFWVSSLEARKSIANYCLPVICLFRLVLFSFVQCLFTFILLLNLGWYFCFRIIGGLNC